MTEPDDFTPDCTACVALCCLALAFDRGDDFAHDKAAGEPCRFLDAHACSIHGALSDRGYRGCVNYDCLGAGQKTTALFDQSWRDAPKMIGPTMQAFQVMRQVQELRQTLHAARALPLPDDERARLNRHLNVLEPDVWTPDSLDIFDDDGTVRHIRTWLRGLSQYVVR